MSEDEKLLCQVAKNLSGRQVTAVRLRPPVWHLASGACYKTTGREAIVDVHPSVDILTTLLHECGHLKLHWNKMTATDIWKMAPESLVVPDVGRKMFRALSQEAENEADHWVSVWKNYVSRYSYRYHGTGIVQCLRCLAEWPVHNS